jgi:hypothetical protein
MAKCCLVYPSSGPELRIRKCNLVVNSFMRISGNYPVCSSGTL